MGTGHPSRRRRSPRCLAACVSVALAVAPASADPPASAPPALTGTGLPYLPEDGRGAPPALVTAIRARREGGRLLNLDRVLLQSPPLAEGWNALFGAIRGKLALPARLRELAILSVGALNRAGYEWGQHEPPFLAAGGTREQLAALRSPEAALVDAAHFDEAERATLALTYEMTRSVQVSPGTLRRVRALLPDRQVVELIGTVAGYNMVSRFVEATGVEMER